MTTHKEMFVVFLSGPSFTNILFCVVVTFLSLFFFFCKYRSSGAPITIGWKPINESVIDLDFYEYCRIPERKSRKKMILSVRRRANV